MSEKEDPIAGYAQGSLTPEQRHALEKKALHDPLLREALEGAESIDGNLFASDLKELSEKIGGKKFEQISFFTPLRIAAGIALLVGLASIIYLMTPTSSPELLTKADVPKSDSIPQKQDSIKPLITQAEPEEKKETAKPAARKKDDVKPAITTLAQAEEEKSSGLVADQAQADDLKTEKDEAEEKQADAEKLSSRGAALQPVTESPAPAGLAKASRDASREETRSKKTVSGTLITGRVTAEDKTPLPGVNVVVKGTNNGTVTDVNGNYAIAADPTDRLVFSFIGMNTAEAAPSHGRLDVSLKEDISQLSEVVVTGFGEEGAFDREPIIVKARPAGGLRAYNKYLENNLRYPKEALDQQVKGRVTIQFIIETDGSLSDFSVLKSLGHGCDEEVIRLVKEGPAWSPTTIDKLPVQSEVLVRLKFDPKKAGGR